MDKQKRKKKTVDDTVCEIHKFSGYAVLSNCFVSEEEEQEQTRHRNRLDYLPVALELLKADYPEGYALIQDYFLSDDKVTMLYLATKFGITIDKVRYRIKIAKEKLKEYIIMHENK